MKREFLQELRVGDLPLPKQVVDAIMAENGRDIQHYIDQAAAWEERYNTAAAAHTAELQRVNFQAALERSVQKHGGRNTKAIAALLELDAITGSQEQEAALDAAMEQLKQAHAYLFAGPTAPPYAGGTGTAPVVQPQVTTLSGALKEKFGRR